MEYMRLDSFLGKQVSKVINKMLASKLGFDPDLLISKFNFESTDNENGGLVKVELTALMHQDDFEKLIEGVTK